MTRTHPTDADLRDFVLGKLRDDESAVVETHLAECPDCLDRAAADPPTDTLLDLLAAVGTRVDRDRDRAAAVPHRDARETPSLGSATLSFAGAGRLDLAAMTPPPELANHPKYRVVRPLGFGGMGTVWLAEHLVMGRRVAVKVIRPECVARPGMAERFWREVQAAAKLAHEHIATAYDAEEVGGRHFLVMEYVPGESLAEAVRGGPLPVAEACRAVRDAARGLAHAHAVGLVHRDVKPSNLVRAPDGTTKVLDFGLATVAGQDGPTLTGGNVVMGTPDYIAPEQAADAGAADAHSDIYSLGCTLYHLLSGRVPYPADTVLAKIDAHRDPVRAPRPIPALVPALASVLTKMMAKNPADRYQRAGEVAAALEPFATVAEPTPAPRRRSRSRWLVAAGLLVALSAIAVAGVVHRIQTDKGELVIETTDDDVEVVVKQGGKLVTVYDPKTKQKLVLQSGTYEFELNGQPTGLKLDIDRATLKRGDTVVARIERVVKPGPKGKEVPPAEPQDEIRRFGGSSESIFAVALSPDGKTAAAGGGGRINNLGELFDKGKDFSIRTWDVATGKPQHRLTGHTNLVRRLAFSPDGRLLASCGHDRTIRLWNLETGKELEAFPVQPDTVFGLAFSPDGKSLASAGHSAPVRLWDVAGRKLVKEFAKFPRSTNAWGAVAFSPNGGKLVAGGWEALVVYDVATGEIDRSIGQPGLYRVGDVSFSADGARLVSSGGPDHMPAEVACCVWNAATGKEQRRYPSRLGTFASADGGTLFVGDAMGRPTILWDVASDRPLAKYTGHVDMIMAQAVSLKTGLAVTGVNDGTVRLFRLPGSTADLQPAKPTASTPAEAKLPLKPGEVFVFRGHTDGVIALAVSPDGKFAVTGGSYPNNKDSALRMWDLATGKEVKQFRGHINDILSIAFSPDGKRIISGSHDFTARIWNVESGKEVMAFDPPGIGFGVAFTRDGNQAVVTCEKARLYDLAAKKDLDRFGEYRCRKMRSLALSPDGSTLATGDSFGDDAAQVVSLWDVKTGKRTSGTGSHLGMIYAVAWSPDGERIASAGSEGTVVVWNPDRGRGVHRLDHPNPVFGVAYSPGGKYLLTGCADSIVRVWDAESGKEVLTLKGHDQPVWAVAFTPDGKHALSVSQDKMMRMWRLPDHLVDPKRK